MSVKRRVSAGGSATADRHAQLLKKLYQVRIDGRSVVELFTEIPDVQMYPDYREVVDVPISLAEIGKRVRVGAYDTDESLIADFELMAENAKAYNGDDSPVYDDAIDILDFVLLYLERGLSKSSRQRLQTQVLDELEAYKYKGRKFSDAFVVEPDAKTYPNYRDIVKHPTSFTKVRKELEANGPKDTWEDFRALVDPIFANAMLYNQEGSQIYNDARSLRKQLDTKIKKYSPIPKHLASALPRSVLAAASVGDDSSDEDASAVSDGNGDDDDDDDEDVAPEPVRYDDDDDEDFEADSDDMDEEDMGDADSAQEGDANGNGMGDPSMMGPQFMQPAMVYDEIVYRPPEEGVKDALLRMVTCHSTPIPPQLAMNLPIEDVKRAENDMLQLRIPPSPMKAFTTFATTLPYYQSTLRLSVLPNRDVQPLQLVVLLNGAKVMPLAIPAPVPPQWENFDISLAPGLNQVTVIAIKSTYGGYMRQYGPPPLADAPADEERMVLFLNLSK